MLIFLSYLLQTREANLNFKILVSGTCWLPFLHMCEQWGTIVQVVETAS